jgi:hypothetical protein
MKRQTAAGSWGCVLVFALVALPLPYLLRFDHGHLFSAAALVLLLIGLALWSRPGALLATLTYLVFLGDYRRYAGYFEGYPKSDPLLLVGALSAFFLACLTVVDGRLKGISLLSGLLGIFSLLMLAEVFNPEQGGIAVGFAGALFYFVPMLWFWIGRGYGDAALVDRVLRWLVIPAAVATALLAIYQSFHGLLPFEDAWFHSLNAEVDYASLYLSQSVRAFGFFTSAAEHLRFILVASVTVLAYWLRGRSLSILLLPLLLGALFLGSSRGPVVMFAATAVVLWSVLARSVVVWIPRAAVAGVVVAGVLAVVLLGLQQAHLDSRIEALVTHQVEGLLNPTDTEKSTAVGHAALAAQGVMLGITSPAGKGLGATTIGAKKYGAGVYSAEVDLSNMFYSLGVLGGLLYITIMIVAVSSAVSVWKQRRSAVELAMLGIALCTLMSWLLGGEYSIAALVWFILGAVDRAGVEIAAQRKHARRNHAYRLSHA